MSDVEADGISVPNLKKPPELVCLNLSLDQVPTDCVTCLLLIYK